MTNETPTAATQDYLRAIYDLTRGQAEARATTKEIAERLVVRPASVTGMLQKMAGAVPPLIDYRKHYGVRLTEDGRRAALAVTRHHRLLEAFLHQHLGYSWDEVHEEADRLEHAISDRLADRLADFLDQPRHDPHGDPIPDRDLRLPPRTAVPLIELPVGGTAVIHHVRDEEPALLRQLAALGLRPGVTIRRLATIDGWQLQIEDQPEITRLTPLLRDQLFVNIETDPTL